MHPTSGNILKFFFSRTIILYLACIFLIWHFVDQDQLINNAVPQTLSRLTPPIDYFAEFVTKEGRYDDYKLMNCINYHRAVAHFFSFQEAEAYGMLGFCNERLGRKAEAIASYQHAITLNADYFWPYYDLGVIYYGSGQYSKALDYFRQAIEQEPVKTLVLLSRSKVYNDVNASRAKGPYDYLESLKQGRAKAAVLMMDCLYRTGDYDQLWKIALEGLKEGLDTHGIYYYYAAVVAFNKRSFDDAMPLLQAALKIDPENADALLLMGMCLKMLNKGEMAQMIINKAALIHQDQLPLIDRLIKPRVCFF